MPNVNPGPSSSTTPNVQSQREVLGATALLTFAALPPPAAVSFGDVAFTSDLGAVWCNGTSWLSFSGGSGGSGTLLVVPNSQAAAPFNTAVIQGALNKGGVVSIPGGLGIVWIGTSQGFANSALIYNSNTTITVGPGTTLTLLPNSNVAMIMSSTLNTFLAGGFSLTGGVSVTLTQNAAPCSVNVAWANHGLVAKQAIMIAGATSSGLKTNPYNGIFIVSVVVDANNLTIFTPYPASAAPAGTTLALAAVQNVRFDGGGTWDCNGANQTNSATIKNHGIMIAGVESVTVDDVTVANCALNNFPVQYALHASFTDIRCPNSDNAWQVLGPARGIWLRGLSGDSNDDFIAIAPGANAPNAWLNAKGDVIDVRIQDVDAIVRSTGVICHIYPPDNETLDQIVIDGITGICAQSPIQININGVSGYTHGYFGRISFANCQPVVTNNLSAMYTIAACTGDSLTIEDVSWVPGVSAGASVVTPLINLISSVSVATNIRTLNLNRLRSNGPLTGAGLAAMVFVGGTAGANINKIMCRDWDIQGGTAGQLKAILLASTANVVKDIEFHGGAFDSTLLDFVEVDNGMTGQATFNVSFVGIETSGANGNGAAPSQGVRIGSGQTQNCNVKFVGCGTLNFTTSAIFQGSGTIAFKLSSSSTDWGATAPISGSGAFTVTAYGFDIPLDAGLAQTTKGQFFTHASAVAGRNAANQQGPCIAVDGTHFYALGTGAAGVNTIIV